MITFEICSSNGLILENSLLFSPVEVRGNLAKRVPQWFSMDLILLGHTKTEFERSQAGSRGHFLKLAGFCGAQKRLFPMKIITPKMYTSSM